MRTDLADRLDAAPELRLVSYIYREEFGHSPSGVWQAPGSVTLLADGQLRLTVAARWGAIVAAGPRSDGLIELIRMNRPDERVRLTVAEAAAGTGPPWARAGLRSARQGATLLVNTDLPEGSGTGATEATQTAIGMALRDLAATGPAPDGQPPEDRGQGSDGQAEAPGGPGNGGSNSQAPAALLGGRRLPFDLDGAGLRLMVIDTRVRGAAQPAIAEHAPLAAAAAALEAGAIEALGPMLTEAHAAMACDDAQQIAVSAALDAGALGARMIVDGPGRPACALLPAPRLADVWAAVAQAFASRQLRAPRFLTVSPADGPRRAA
jgi:galactokinase